MQAINYALSAQLEDPLRSLNSVFGAFPIAVKTKCITIGEGKAPRFKYQRV